MKQPEISLIEKLNIIIEQIISGKLVNYNLDEINGNDSVELNKLTDNIKLLTEQYNDNYNFILDLSKGKLDITPPPKNNFANAYKQLHSELLHLTWQIQQIAQGDYDQKVSFSGDFSDAINKMVESLREKQRLEDLNKENEHFFNTIFDILPDGVLISDLKGMVQYISNSGKAMFGLNDDDIKNGINFFSFVSEKDKERALKNNADRLKGKYSGFSEYRVVHKNGTEFWNESNANILYDSSGNPKGLIVVFRDITKRKENEEKLERYTEELKELNAMKDKFFSIIGHDLKNPFFVIINTSEVLYNDFNELSDSKKQELISGIKRSSERAYKLLENLLNWSKSQTGKMIFSPEVLQLKSVVKECIKLKGQQSSLKKIKLTYDIPADCLIYADINMLRTIIRNLLSNAIKYTPNEGAVNVSVSESEEYYQITVSDTGMGISPQDIKKLFRIDIKNSEIGHSNEKGTGLGLILCKEFVEKHGGKIWVESQERVGSKFSFTIPKKNF
jgi:PAS domain S-box-containing protein